MTGGERNRRTLVLASLAVLGIVYSVVAIRIWMLNWIALLPIMERALGYRMLFGPFWFAVEATPITIAVVLLRLRPEQAIIVVFACLVVMSVAQYVFESFNVPLFLNTVVLTPFCLALQVPVWALTSLIVKFAHRGR